MLNEKLEMKVAASPHIYGAMPESGISVNSHSFLSFYRLDLISDLAGTLEVFAIDAALEFLS